MQHVLEVPLGGTNETGQCGMSIGQCKGLCTEAPMVWINGEVTRGLTVASAIRLARGVKGS